MTERKTDDPARARRYVTTAIPYVNAAPHIGFALEAVQADALARFYRARGDAVRLQAGTDENSLKNVLAAEAVGVPVADLVADNAARFAALQSALNLSYDDFIRTSADPRHRPGVEALWRACAARGDLYKRPYEGLHCTGCEQFYREADLPGGLCPEHGTAPERIAEENWFFRLSRYEAALRDVFESGALEVAPPSRGNEIRAWLDAGLEDFNVSRSADRARGWGIPVPGDPTQVVYVWFDALANYITALGFGAASGGGLRAWWHDAIAREHVVGKGITRFHALYWPAILLSAGLPPPTRLIVHGYVTVDGRKIGKSAGNAVDPVPMAAAMGSDALRYFLLRHIRGDGDFSEDRFRAAYEKELAGQLGNLLHRVVGMLVRYRDGIVPTPPSGHAARDRLLKVSEGLAPAVAAEMERAAFDRALYRIWDAIAAANRYVSEVAPWDLARRGDTDALDGALFSLAATLSEVGRCLAPFLPAASRELASRTDGAGAAVRAGPPLFPVPR